MLREQVNAGNTHAAWADWPRGRQTEAWALHCAVMAAEGLTVTQTAEERTRVVQGARERLLSVTPLGPFRETLARLTHAERAALVARFERSLPSEKPARA